MMTRTDVRVARLMRWLASKMISAIRVGRGKFPIRISRPARTAKIIALPLRRMHHVRHATRGKFQIVIMRLVLNALLGRNPIVISPLA
jgi:hypothetical protein